MFDTVILGSSCPDKEYREFAPVLRMRLFEAQLACRTQKIPLLVQVCGLEGSGRGDVMNLLSEWMDAKFLRSHTFWEETDEQRQRPLEWRFWRCLPAGGETAIFFDGWYGTLRRKLFTGEFDRSGYMERLQEFRRLEDSLARSGMGIVKLWLHIDRKSWEKRLQDRLDKKSLRHFAPLAKKLPSYKAMMEAASEAITVTDRENSPWAIIDARDKNFRNLSVAKAIVETAERMLALKSAASAGRAALNEAGKTIAGDLVRKSEAPFTDAGSEEGNTCGETGCAPETACDKTKEGKTDSPKTGAAGAGAGAGSDVLANMRLTMLDAVDLGRKLDREEYKKKLASLQEEVHELTFLAWQKGISSTILFEGMDASGKGGAIRRLQQAVDTRISRTIPISSPSDEELAHHYLWRFWRHVPKKGFVTIYDRSWYGRVLVERVEELTPRCDWSRAYAEINHFEQQLTSDGNILLKFWLHISPEEELARFRERENTPWKRYKITPDDWRNRSKWDKYMEAADEMFLRTSTLPAPWNIVPAEDKKYARVEVLKIWRDALKKALGKRDGRE